MSDYGSRLLDRYDSEGAVLVRAAQGFHGPATDMFAAVPGAQEEPGVSRRLRCPEY